MGQVKNLMMEAEDLILEHNLQVSEGTTGTGDEVLILNDTEVFQDRLEMYAYIVENYGG